MDVNWTTVAAWGLLWFTTTMAGIALGLVVGSLYRPHLRKAKRDQWSALLGAVGILLPTLYWWYIGIEWCMEQIW